MKRAQLVGLIAAGNLTGAPLTRFWWLTERLGPVKSGTYRVASRIVNMLRAGHPVKDYAEFAGCSLILIAVPDESLPHAIAGMLSSGISWRGKTVVVCSPWLSSAELREFSALGAHVGSVSPIPGFDDERYLIEGDSVANRQARNLVEHRTRQAITVERGLKPLYLAALTCTGTLLFAMVRAAFESLQYAGIPAAQSTVVIERQMARTLRSYLKGGRRAFPPPRDLPRQLRLLASASPELAQYLDQSCRLAVRLMEKRL